MIRLKTINACLIGLLVFTAAAGPLWAGLTWEKKDLSLTADPDETELLATFRFKNTGEHPVTITAVHPSCGCTTVALPKQMYASGEEGEIPVVYHYTSSSGERVNTVLVQTDEPSVPPVQLKLAVEVPPLSVSIRPQLLFWTVKEKPEPKIARVTLRGERGFQLAGIEVEGEGFRAETRPPAKGAAHQHVVVVTPLQTEKPSHATLLVTFNRPNKIPKAYRVRLAVKTSAAE